MPDRSQLRRTWDWISNLFTVHGLLTTFGVWNWVWGLLTAVATSIVGISSKVSPLMVVLGTLAGGALGLIISNQVAMRATLILDQTSGNKGGIPPVRRPPLRRS